MLSNTKKTKSTIALLLVFSFILVSLSQSFTAKAEANTIVVPDDYSSIQEAINNAGEGDTVFVMKGTYEEHSLAINKTLTLIGEDKSITTIITDMDSNNASIRFAANYVKITGFTLTGAVRGIEGTGNNTQIIDNIIIAEGNRLTLKGSHQTIAQNVIKAPHNATIMLSPAGGAFGTGYGIRCSGSYNNISANEFAGPSLENIMLEGSFNIVYGNNVKDSGFMKVYGNRNIIAGNNMTGDTVGIWIYTGSNNIVCANRINGGGLSISSGYENTFYANHVTNSMRGVSIERLQSYLDNEKGPWTMNNTIYNNNFMNNTYQVHTYNDTNFWDNGVEGNFWSDYTGKDSNGDGIGDTPYVIASNRQDNYPLMAPIKIFDAGTWEWTQYNVNIISNSTVSDFSFNPEEGALIRFNVEDETGTTGFCRVTIPKDLLDAEDDWIVLVDGASVTPTVNEDTNNTYLYFTYQHSTKTVEIIGTTAIPEFPSWIILPLFMVETLLTVVYKRLFKKA